jgi:IS30 family transposase
MRRTYSHIGLDERRKIARWRMAGLSIEIIAEKLGRHRSTIFREIKRNMFVDKVVPDLNGYYCVTAHGMACERRAKLRKLARFSHVRQSVVDRIMHGWSPQQIAGRMRLERHPISVSHETIYKFAYSADGQAIKLWRHLPEHRARRRPRHARRRHGRRFSPELNILHRPDVVADRKQFGHWECDLIQFRKKFGKANVTSLVERVSRFAIFLRNNDRQSRPVMDGVIQALQALPHLARRSITFDRGKHQRPGAEMAFERARSIICDRCRPDRDLQSAECDAAQMPRLPNASGGLSKETARPDEACRLA